MVKNYLKPVFWALLAVLSPLVEALEPVAIYLTWVNDPTTTMVVQWQTPAGKTLPQLEYQIKGDLTRKSAQGHSQTVQDYDVHRVYLEGLTEDSVYLFKVQDSKREFSFQTMPKKLTRPVKMAIGGDAYHARSSEIFHRMNRMIAFNQPDFIVIGGDLAYTVGAKNLLKGPQWALTRWQAFLRDLQRSIGQNGRLIPLLPLVGNHDVSKHKNRAELFYEIFTFPEAGKAYRSLDFGDYLSLVMLDTGHTWQVAGDQTVWLENTLKTKQSVPYLLAAYHVAAYPSYEQYSGEKEQMIRKSWVPLFEKYQVPFAFEHHNHVYKRTHPIKDGKVNPSGVTYLGDGSWGVSPRQVNTAEKRWYLEKSASASSCFIVTLSREKCLIEAKNSQGEVIDLVSKASPAPVSSD